MIKTDYAKISRMYDQNKDRLNIEKDTVIEELLRTNSTIRVLDLACGTGNYLQKQIEVYQDQANIEWYGVDLSKEMLDIARRKCPTANFRQINVDDLDAEHGFFHYVVCNFAFHHFEHKLRALNTVQRILAKNGIFKMTNLIPEFIKGWWIYHYCEEAFYVDLHRFWEKGLIVYELENLGFRPHVKIQYTQEYKPLETLLGHYRRRDTSQLTIVPESAYETGLKKIESDIRNGQTEYRDEFALIEIRAEKVY